MPSKSTTGISIVTDESGKQRVVRVHKLPAGQKKNLHTRAAKSAKKWKAKSKSK